MCHQGTERRTEKGPKLCTHCIVITSLPRKRTALKGAKKEGSCIVVFISEALLDLHRWKWLFTVRPLHNWKWHRHLFAHLHMYRWLALPTCKVTESQQWDERWTPSSCTEETSIHESQQEVSFRSRLASAVDFIVWLLLFGYWTSVGL